MYYSDDVFFEIISENIDVDNKPRRASSKEVRDLFASKGELTKNQRLAKSIIE